MKRKNSKKWFGKRKNTKKVDIQKSLEKLDQAEFYIYWPHPGIDLDEYKDEDDNIDIDKIPDEDLFEFQGRYLNMIEWSLITNPRQKLDFDRNEYKGQNLSEAKLQELFVKAIIEQSENVPTDDEVTFAVCAKCLLEPKMTAEQVSQILPYALANEIADTALHFIDKGSLVAKLEEHHKTNEVK